MTRTEVSSGDRLENLWVYVAKYLHLRQVTFVSGFKRAKPIIEILDIGMVLLAVGVAIGCYLLSMAILRELNSPIIVQSRINPAVLMDTVPALVLAAVFLLTMLASFRVLLQALWLARDMDFPVAATYPTNRPCMDCSCTSRSGVYAGLGAFNHRVPQPQPK